MTDDEVGILLRSTASLVVIEAPAGCGKTHQAASYTSDVATNLPSGQILVLTHTHAACSVIAERTASVRANVNIRTLDSLIHQIATAYRIPLNLPTDVAAWCRQNGYEVLAEKVADLLHANPMICQHLARQFPVVICDEHQDANDPQYKIALLLHANDAIVRVFADPMQLSPGGRGQVNIAAAAEERWNALKVHAAFGELEIGHRWKNTNPDLGVWIQAARQALKNGNSIDLSEGVPTGVEIIFAENNSRIPNQYQLAPENWRTLDVCLDRDCSMLLIAANNNTVHRLRGSLRRRFPIWEGHTRSQLENLVAAFSAENTLEQKINAFTTFLQTVLTGFTNQTYCNRLRQEIAQPSDSPRGDIPPQLKAMAEAIRNDPSHVGFAKVAEHLKTLVSQKAAGFANLNIDYPRELSDFIKLCSYTDVLTGFAEIQQRRSRAHPKPPRKCLSTVHKCKGLEAEQVVIFACDGTHFPDTIVKRNLLYVALSRATQNVTIILSREDPTPLFSLPAD